MSRIVGVVIAITFAVFWITNALFMLISPKSWFRLPSWLRGSRKMTEEEYGSGWGAVDVQTLGAIFLGAAVYVLYDMFLRHK
jgi:hypothetical protein